MYLPVTTVPTKPSTTAKAVITSTVSSTGTTTEICPLAEVMDKPSLIGDKQISANKPDGTPSNARPGKGGWIVPVPRDETEEKPALTVDMSNKEQVEPVYVDRVVVKGNVKTITVETYTRPSFSTTASTFTGQTGSGASLTSGKAPVSGEPTISKGSSTPSAKQVEQGQSSATGAAGQGQTTTPVGVGAASTTPAAEAFVTVLQDTDVPENGVVFLPTPVRLDWIKVIFESPETPDETNYKVELAVHACFNYTGERRIILVYFIDSISVCPLGGL